MLVLIILFICRSHTPAQGKYIYNGRGKGLTEIPKDIQCEALLIRLENNFISRIEDGAFPCHGNIERLKLSNNDVIYIAPGAFQFCFSLKVIWLNKNRRLQQLPPSFGPTTPNITRLFCNDLNIMSLPDGYFRRFKSLDKLYIVNWGINAPSDNAVLKGLPSLRRVLFLYS